MKKFRINLALTAMVLGVTAAFAFKPAATAKTNRLVDITWQRTGTALSPDGNTWVQSGTGACDEATRLCKATFASGYNPNTHTYSQNVANATSVIADQGVVIP